MSAMTIRRDIAELADKGLLKRVHGGAVTTSTLLSEPLFSVKSQMDIGLKDAIAQEAIKYVAPGDVIAIGGGTTAYVFAQHLLESQQSSGITILTNSIPVAELVQALESKDVEVIVTGGVITRSNSLVGPIADKVVASLRVNTVFLGTHSVSIPRGFLMPNSLEAATDMAMMDIADRTIVLTDHTKWSCTSLSLFARFDQVDTVITDDGLDPDSAAKTKDLVKELVLAHQSETIEESEVTPMADFANYTPGEYAKKHIRITPTTLADGRDFFYLDDDPEFVSGAKTRELKDPRPLDYRFAPHLDADGNEVPYAAPQMRRDPLTGDWIPMATARMNRPITAGPGATAKGNPLAARKPGDPYQDGEVPDTDYNVVVFENRFPSMVRVPGVSEDVTYVDGNPLWEKKLAAGRCEVICFDPNENGLPADLPVSRLRTVVEAWAFRTAEISKMEGIEQIFPFENHGQEIGVSLAHPHGQVYCYPFIAPKMEKELQHTEAYHEKTGGNLLKDIMNAELEAGERIVMRNHSWVAYVPAAARWPLEVHVAPVRDVLTLDELNDEERWDLASMYSHLLKRGNAFFDKGDGKGMDLPYIAAWHQAPIHDARRENYRLNLQFFSFRRAANKIKYLAGSESGMAAWISDTTPELIAKRFHELGSIDIAD